MDNDGCTVEIENLQENCLTKRQIGAEARFTLTASTRSKLKHTTPVKSSSVKMVKDTALIWKLCFE